MGWFSFSESDSLCSNERHSKRCMITPHVRSLLASAVRTACASVVIIGAGVIVGWVFGITPLTSLIAGLPTMKVNGAVGVILAACGLWMLRDDERRGGVGAVCAVVALALGLASVSEGV